MKTPNNKDIEKTKRLLICITFHFNTNRLQYLQQATKYISQFPLKTDIVILTNKKDGDAHNKIKDTLSKNNIDAKIETPYLLGHPYLLTWCHLSIFRESLESSNPHNYFLYMEDDLCITPENISYWLTSRELLRSTGLLPAFVRYEYKDGTNIRYSTDAKEQLTLASLPTIKIANDLLFVSLPRPYQGMYILDQELLAEHLTGNSSNPDFGQWGIREKAAQGLTFAKVPRGYHSRNVVGFDHVRKQIHSHALVHHTPNNYANDAASRFGKIPLHDLFNA